MESPPTQIFIGSAGVGATSSGTLFASAAAAALSASACWRKSSSTSIPLLWFLPIASSIALRKKLIWNVSVTEATVLAIPLRQLSPLALLLRNVASALRSPARQSATRITTRIMPADIVPSLRGRSGSKSFRQLTRGPRPDGFCCWLIADTPSELEVDEWRDPLGTKRID